MRKKELEARLQGARHFADRYKDLYKSELRESNSAQELVDDLLLLLDATREGLFGLRMRAEAKRYVQNHEAMFALAGERKAEEHDDR